MNLLVSQACQACALRLGRAYSGEATSACMAQLVFLVLPTLVSWTVPPSLYLEQKHIQENLPVLVLVSAEVLMHLARGWAA